MANKAGYEYLLGYKLTVPIYDYTSEFVRRHIDYKSRTRDQMEQAARSGMQNISEGYKQQSLAGYIRLAGVSRGSLEELLKDYLSFARQHKIAIWDKEKAKREIGEISEIWEIIRATPTLPDNPNFPALPNNPEIAVNLMITLIQQANYLIDKLIISLKQKHAKEGGFTEKLLKKRLDFRRNGIPRVVFIFFMVLNLASQPGVVYAQEGGNQEEGGIRDALASFTSRIVTLNNTAQLLSEKTNFKATEIPEFRVIVPQKTDQSLGQTKENEFQTNSEKITANLKYTSTGEKLAVGITKDKQGEFRITPKDLSKMEPGKYELEVSAKESFLYTRNFSQDFSWGVLAINTNKSIYILNDIVKVSFGVVDDEGHTVCDAKLFLTITDPNNKSSTISTEDGKIDRSKECKGDSYTMQPDYMAQFRVLTLGRFGLMLKAETKNGTHEISDFFDVVESVDFDVERFSFPSRIYPPSPYPVTLHIKANKDFEGEIADFVPKNFIISKITAEGKVLDEGNKKKISWQAKLQKGHKYQLDYTIKFPPVSPEFYLLGPVMLFTSDGGSEGDSSEVFREKRQWQIAADAEVVIDSATSFTNWVFNASPYTVFTSDTTGYTFYRDDPDATGQCVYSKTTDSGATWGAAVVYDSQTDCYRPAVWYDRWTPGDTTGTKIHITNIDITEDRQWYTSLDTSGDTLTTPVDAISTNQTLVITDATNNFISITKGTDGDLYMGAISSTDSYVIKCTATCTTGANWSEAGTNPFDNDNTDEHVLVPLASGNIMAIRRDASLDDIQSKIFTDSSGTWAGAWTNIDTNATEHVAFRPAIGATVDRATNNIYIVYAADVEAQGTDDDCRTAVYNGTSWTAKTDVVTDDATGIRDCKIAIEDNTDNVYVAYQIGTSTLNYKLSTDGMTTWGTATTFDSQAGTVNALRMNIISNERIYATYSQDAAGPDLLGNTIADLAVSSTIIQGGVTINQGVTLKGK